MGLESLSRGATRAVFFDMDRSALALLRRNIADLAVQDRSMILALDIFKWARKPATIEPADLVFLDPPYRMLREMPDELRELAAALARCLKPGASIVFRHSATDALPLPGLTAWDQRSYGDMTIELLRAQT